MRTLFVDGLGTFTAVGLNVPQTMGSLRAAYARHRELAVYQAGARALVGAPTPIATDVAVGELRLQAMGAFALGECAEGRSLPLPLVICLPPMASEQAHRIMIGVAGHSGAAVDLARSRVLVGGQAIFATALAEADAMLTAGTATACYVGGVDSLLDADRLAALMRAGRIKDEDNPDGFIPGEGAAFLCVSHQRRASTLAWLRGLAVAEETAVLHSDRPNTAVGLTAAIKGAMHDGGSRGEDLALLAHPASGERYFLNEFALAAIRLRIPRRARVPTWTPGISVGDIGVAAGALTVAYLSFLVHDDGFAVPDDRAQPTRTAALCGFSDADTLRGAVVVDQVPRG